ncbi:MAG: hypothetical protein JKY34_08620 [Kordiimonadaceae bacterium]|nr:hypothetical protein [Kordiimonadaceae bacterium]
MHQQVNLDAFRGRATELYGSDPKGWKFACPRCHTPQSALDWDAESIDREVIEKQIGFSCIGRQIKDKGCNWTLGGLLQLHDIEIVDGDGNTHPHFRLHDPANSCLSVGGDDT